MEIFYADVIYVFGIIIRMQSERGGKHHKPHIHCIYNEYEIVIALDGEILEGSMPDNKLSLIRAWMVIHEEELKVAWNAYQNEANWDLLFSGDGFFRIDPLR